MSDQLARTGTAGTLVIGGVAVTGYYLLAIALAVVLAGALCIRLAFRHRLDAGQPGSPTGRGRHSRRTGGPR
ncbi:hypothetical protein ACFWQ6_00955 [Streptomyces coelicoflavus]|uniref:hypothetical protein n=1 Tax=Streptomyces coelicoflavus TaxID=285562 RepID=UPI003654B834